MSDMIVCDTRQSKVIPKLSIIVPVYNTSGFVEKTLSSFDKNGNDQIELIIVNDGSTDNSVEVVQQWLDTYKGNAIFVSQENKGLSEARNTALRYANGQYISFCDSDDWLNEKAVLDSLEFAESDDLDIVLYRSYVYDNQTKDSYPFYDAATWDHILGGELKKTVNIAAYPQILSLEPNTNNRILKKEFFDKYITIFPVGIHFEDVTPHIVSLVNATKIGMIDTVGYFYRVNREGKITDQKSEKRFDIIKTAKELLQKPEVKGLNAYQQYCVMSLIFKMIFWCGRYTTLNDRRRYFQQGVDLFSVSNPGVRSRLKTSLGFAERNREFILMLAFFNGATDFLTEYSTGKQTLSTKFKLLKAISTANIDVNKLIFKKALRFAKNKFGKRVVG
ncbi:glycosyltransferase [Klebsiella sp. CN_Kp073]|uniref:glycosyltransferase family 2 protein n=1 Tax=Klebsiella sp. CN_Kp073 TaxID=3153412 RepID=UPI0032B5E90F